MYLTTEQLRVDERLKRWEASSRIIVLQTPLPSYGFSSYVSSSRNKKRIQGAKKGVPLVLFLFDALFLFFFLIKMVATAHLRSRS